MNAYPELLGEYNFLRAEPDGRATYKLNRTLTLAYLHFASDEVHKWDGWSVSYENLNDIYGLYINVKLSVRQSVCHAFFENRFSHQNC